MHYRFWPDEVPQCSGQTGTNYSNAGLTSYDKLALHIMHPETNQVAEFTGKTVVKTGEPLILRSTWVQQGATSFAVKNFRWHLSRFLMSIDDTLNMTFDSPACTRFSSRTRISWTAATVRQEVFVSWTAPHLIDRWLLYWKPIAIRCPAWSAATSICRR